MYSVVVSLMAARQNFDIANTWEGKQQCFYQNGRFFAVVGHHSHFLQRIGTIFQHFAANLFKKNLKKISWTNGVWRAAWLGYRMQPKPYPGNCIAPLYMAHNYTALSYTASSELYCTLVYCHPLNKALVQSARQFLVVLWRREHFKQRPHV